MAERALRHPGDHRVLFLPVNEPPRRGDELSSQHFAWGRYEQFFGRYGSRGLEPVGFFFSNRLGPRDAELLAGMLLEAPVAILSSGSTPYGVWRMLDLGLRLFGDASLLPRLLLERQARGLLTAGVSAGAQQLCSLFDGRGVRGCPFLEGFGLAQDVAVQVHHDSGGRRRLRSLARKRKRCLWFGLPNDSAIEVSHGRLPSGLRWQLLRFLIDTSYDEPRDQWHIKTRQGMKIDHFYADGRHWAFNHGDMVLQVRRRRSQHFSHAWLATGQGVLDYASQRPTGLPDVGALLQALARSR